MTAGARNLTGDGAHVHPAKAIGIYEEYGRLSAGKFADLLILDEELELKQVFRHGRRAKAREFLRERKTHSGS